LEHSDCCTAAADHYWLCQSGIPRQQHAFESFPFYAVSVIAALNFGASATTVSVLAALYLAFRIAHALLYIADKSSLRSAAYAGGLFANIAIFLSPALKINFF
jgi:uncharacterized MAPEG superfamily protein